MTRTNALPDGAAAPAEGDRPDDRRLQAAARALAATNRGTLGQARAFVLARHGARVCFLEARAPTDARQGLWIAEDGSQPRLLVDPDDLGQDDVPAAERARRERARQTAGGITAYAATPDLELIVFAHGGRLHVVTTADGSRRVLEVAGPVVDPRPSPTGRHVAWVADGALHVVGIDDGDARTLAADDAPDVTWGLAEFVAAEEMDRHRGYWWSPDGATLAVCRADVSAVQTWWVHEPTDPGRTPTAMRYPAAGTANADVSLWLIGRDGSRVEVEWDHDALPYLAAVDWTRDHPLTIAVQSRDQRRVDVLAVDTRDGSGVRTVRHITADPWVHLVPGTPCWSPAGDLVTVEDDAATDTRRVLIDGSPQSPAGLQVDAVLAVRDDDIVVRANADDATAVTIWQVPSTGDPAPRPLSALTGVHHAVVNADAMVLHSEHAHDTVSHAVLHHGGRAVALTELRAGLPVHPQPIFARLEELNALLLLPSWYGGGALPVLLDPYGGPHAQRVVQAARRHLTGQWFAEAGFAVVVIDGRGTPGRGPAWEYTVHGDLAGPALDDQVRGVHAAARQWPMLDLSRVAIRGWSFGGYLAALAVLRRPDVFHAAIAGAPVTDWQLYDTHYTERYLGDPATHEAAYRASSLLDDADDLRRPLLLMHGLADDNVVAAHTLRLSQALLRAGSDHRVLPLPDTTHITRDPRQQAGLLWAELTFLRGALGHPPATSEPVEQ